MKTNKKGLSIIFALVILLIAGTTSLYLLSFIVPYGRNVKGLENSTMAYYLANSGVEQSIWNVIQNPLGFEDIDPFVGSVDYSYAIDSNGTRIPESGLGNSNFDSDWNKIGFNSPIQLSIGEGRISNWSIVDFDFRVPDFDLDGNVSNQSLSGSTSTVVMSWQLSSRTNTLLPSSLSDFITTSDINSSTVFNLSARNGVELDGVTSRTFSDFYINECSGVGNPCVLKISVLGNMNLNDGNNTIIPYLEYYIDTGTQSIPSTFSHINISGKSFGYRKDTSIKIPQLTTDQAFDFTVFQ